jgi:hypothetical protein
MKGGKTVPTGTRVRMVNCLEAETHTGKNADSPEIVTYLYRRKINRQWHNP